MENVSVWGAVVGLLSAGGLGAVMSKVTDYLLARNKQPVDFYQQLINTQAALAAKDREHLEKAIEAIRIEHRDCMDKHIEAIRMQGELSGRLTEQRELLQRMLKMSEDKTVVKLIQQDTEAK